MHLVSVSCAKDRNHVKASAVPSLILLPFPSNLHDCQDCFIFRNSNILSVSISQGWRVIMGPLCAAVEVR